MDKLVDRLRTGANFHESEGDIGLPAILREAADALEGQQGKLGTSNEALRTALAAIESLERTGTPMPSTKRCIKEALNE